MEKINNENVKDWGVAIIEEYGSKEEALNHIFNASSTTVETENCTVFEIMEDLDTDDMRVI